MHVLCSSNFLICKYCLKKFAQRAEIIYAFWEEGTKHTISCPNGDMELWQWMTDKVFDACEVWPRVHLFWIFYRFVYGSPEMCTARAAKKTHKLKAPARGSVVYSYIIVSKESSLRISATNPSCTAEGEGLFVLVLDHYHNHYHRRQRITLVGDYNGMGSWGRSVYIEG